MAFRGSLASSLLSSSSLGNNRSQSNSRSSLLGVNTKPPGVLTGKRDKTKTKTSNLDSSQDDLHSYLSSFNSSKSATAPGAKKQKGIDWERLVESRDAPQGIDYEMKVYGGFEDVSSDDEQNGNIFLKTETSTKPRHSRLEQKQHTHIDKHDSQLKPASLRGSVGSKLSGLKYVRGSTDFMSTFGDEDETIGVSDSESSTSNTDDTSPLAHVRVGSELTLSDNTDTDRDRDKHSLPLRQTTRKPAIGQSESHHNDSSELLKEEEDTDLEDDTISSEPLNLHKNVFSIDELGAITPEDEEPLNSHSISNEEHSESSVRTELHHGSNIRNVFTINDLEMRTTAKEGSMSSGDQLSKRPSNSKNGKSSVAGEQDSSSHQNGKKFKFSATGGSLVQLSSSGGKKEVVTSRTKHVQRNKVVASTSPVVSDISQSIAESVVEDDGSKGNEYSHDEDFESETLSEHKEEVNSSGALLEDTVVSETSSDNDDGINQRRNSNDDGSHSSGNEHHHDSTDLTESRLHHHETTKPSAHKHSSTKETSSPLSGQYPERKQEPQINTDSYIWPRVVVGAHYGKEYLDPSPILPHVVPADTLEVLTAYSPSMVALTDMLRAQLHLTRQLVANSQQLVTNLSSNISADHHYTTLEETREYIAKHRPRIISTTAAMQQVEKEKH